MRLLNYLKTLLLKKKEKFTNKTRFDYKPVCSQFAITHYVAVYKTIHMYYLKKSHDSLNRSCD